jgi:hypothetical protein
MTRLNDSTVDAGPASAPTSRTHRARGLVGTAAALLRWSARPAELFVWTAVTLTGISLVPPLLAGSDAATAATLVVLHLLAAAVVVPALARSLRTAAA